MSSFIRKFLVLLLIIGFGVPILPGVAQSERTELSGNYTVIVPDGWTKGEVSSHGTLFINGDSTLTVFAPDEVAALLGDFDGSDLKERLSTVFNQTHDFEADQQAVEDTKFDDHDAATWNYTIEDQPDVRGAFIVVQLDTEHYAALDILSPKETFDDSMAAGREILRSLSATPVSSGEPCLVSTETELSVALRVGPGTNRTSIAFLPAGKDFTVLGKTADKSGKIWYQLDKSEVAPKSAANQLWVLSDDVTTSGSCDSVADADAPPIVPIVQALPPSTSGNTGGSSETGGSAVPRAGNWTISFASSVPASCLDNPGLTVQMPLQLPPLSMTISDTRSASIVVDGDLFTSPQPGTYQGLTTLPDGTSVLLTLRMVSDSIMTAEFIVTIQIQGTMCSATVNGTATHN